MEKKKEKKKKKKKKRGGGGGNALRLNLKDSREGFHRNEMRSFHVQAGPKTEMALEPTVKSLVRGIYGLRVSEAEDIRLLFSQWNVFRCWFIYSSSLPTMQPYYPKLAVHMNTPIKK